MLDMKKLIAKMLDKSVSSVVQKNGSKRVPSASITNLVPETSYGDENSGLYLVVAMLRCGTASYKTDDLQLRISGTGLPIDLYVQKSSSNTTIGQTATLVGTGGKIKLETYQTTGSAVTVYYDLTVIKLA